MNKMPHPSLCVIFTNGIILLNFKKIITKLKLKKMYLIKSINRSNVKHFYFYFNEYINIPCIFLFLIIEYYTSIFLIL